MTSDPLDAAVLEQAAMHMRDGDEYAARATLAAMGLVDMETIRLLPRWIVVEQQGLSQTERPSEPPPIMHAAVLLDGIEEVLKGWMEGGT